MPSVADDRSCRGNFVFFKEAQGNGITILSVSTMEGFLGFNDDKQTLAQFLWADSPDVAVRYGLVAQGSRM